ncbi:MAG: amino acid adenylation domain-containing protein, partial [Phycisphaerales bacterium]|nr:amino acid adenylation domain-containing protein [Phycisphaerales bacterium]
MAEPHPPVPRLLQEFIDLTAGAHPAVIAVDVPPGPGRPDRIVRTYAELVAEADALAATISPLVSPDDVVGVLLPRSSHWVYVAQLAVLKAGGAFTCIDPVFPDAHVRAVLVDGDVTVVLTDHAGVARVQASGADVAHVIDVVTSSSDAPPPPPTPRPSPVPTPSEASATPKPENLAYVIYTSGTTGAPKGVMIEHRSIVNLVASDLDEFGLKPGDRVGQGSSAAYDSSIEETWLAFASGATLVVMDDHTSRMGPDLVPWLRDERISVFCPPPTLLRTTGCQDPQHALPDLRLLYVGGEALTEDLAERWARGRRLVNGYGPTECTVTVVRGDVLPGRAVTIGRPVPGHEAWVLDSHLNEVADGESGELCLTGIGLARGYRHRDEVTREKFPEHPRLGRVYRTGDLVRREPDGELVYLGRIDAQVKLRGYRIELEAIEAKLAECVGVREAGCRVQGQAADGSDALLVAHVVATDADAPPQFGAIKDALRAVLPPYMVPSRMALIDSLPRSIGAKVDRKRLPHIAPSAHEQARHVELPANDIEAKIVASFASALRLSGPISTTDDFFVDLGGDSLSAVAVICSLRESPATAPVTTRDLYEARTASALARRLTGDRETRSLAPPRARGVDAGVAHHAWTTAAQCAWLVLKLLVVSAAATGVAFDLLPLLLDRVGLVGTVLLQIPLVVVGMFVYLASTVALTVFLKWALIGRYRRIRTRVWSGEYLRHWIVQNAARSIPWTLLAGTTAYGVVLRMLGATIGRRVHIHRGVNLQHGGWDLLSIGDDVTLSRDVHIGLVTLEDGCLCIGPVRIGDRATLDIRANVGSDTTIEADGFLAALSWLPDGGRIGAGERWDGVPASLSGPSPATPTPTTSGSLHPTTYSLLHLLAVGTIGAATLTPALVSTFVLAWIFGVSTERVEAWLAAPAWSVGSVALLIAMAAISVPIWLVFIAFCVRCAGRVRPGVINRWSLAYLRVWLKTSAVESSGLWLTGTLFWPLWLRLAGMKVGRGCEISTISDVVPENIAIGAGTFFADGIYLGAPVIHRGTVTIRDTSLGRATFLGNHVVIPAGAALPDDFFIGVCTVADGSRARAGSSWFGHPPLELPRREVISVDPRLTHTPSALRYSNRLFWESLRFALP